MKCAIVKSDKSIEQGVYLSDAQAVELSKLAENAAIIDLNESPSGYLVIYQNGVTRLYDPVENTIIGKHDAYDEHNGWF